MGRHGFRVEGCGEPWRNFAESMAGIGRGFEDWGDFPFGGFNFRWGGPGRHGRRGRRRLFGGGELRLVLLKLIADEPRHGYELMKALEDMTGGAYSPSPGTVYPTLSLLEDEGAIEENKSKGGTRKAFAVTDAGRAELEDKADEVEALMARLAGIGEREEQHRPPELGRAFANFGRAVANRFREGRLDSDAIEEIVDIIDEAAKRIERL
jgi:DNA-binding PadR family transcriptional regulator